MKTELKPTKKFLATYYHDGGRWCIIYDAYDFPDAQERSRKLGLSFDGEYMGTVPGGMPGARWLAELCVWAKIKPLWMVALLTVIFDQLLMYLTR